jgi:endo-1,4-beta-xylanase
VLKYRVVDPDIERSWDNLSPLLALGDAARAMRLLRQNAAEWKIDPAHIGIMGFSAGGTMAIRLTLDANDGKPGAADPVETQSSRPNFIALIYSTLPDQKFPKVDKNVPYFIAHAVDDKKAPPAVSVKLYQNVIAAGGSAELHMFRQGDHGFGMQPAGTARGWPALYANWMHDVALQP